MARSCHHYHGRRHEKRASGNPDDASECWLPAFTEMTPTNWQACRLYFSPKSALARSRHAGRIFRNHDRWQPEFNGSRDGIPPPGILSDPLSGLNQQKWGTMPVPGGDKEEWGWPLLAFRAEPRPRPSPYPLEVGAARPPNALDLERQDSFRFRPGHQPLKV
jgi:hypothetical protein